LQQEYGGHALAPDDGGPAASAPARRQPAAQLRAVGRHQAAPDTVLADVPAPQRQRQALARTRQLMQMVIAAAASRRAMAGSLLAGNRWSGSRPLSAHRLYLTTQPHKA
jgi:hypothetical protein